jgi:hypothetical protein
VLAVSILASLVAPGATPGAATQVVARAPRPALASFQVRATTNDQLLDVRWSEDPSHTTYTVLHLELFKVSGGRLLPQGAVNIGNTVEPSSYRIPVPRGTWVVRATPENRSGFGRQLTSPQIWVNNPCPTATVCAQVTTVPDPAPVRLAGQGFLLSLTDWFGNLRNAGQVRSLAPRQWRFSGAVSDPAAKGLSVSRTQILSNLWNSWTAPGNGGHALTPWSDWERWRSFVRTTVLQARLEGWSPDYWDVWNEPNGTCCPRFSEADRRTTTVDRWLETYVLANREIRAADPDARVVGPSLSALQWAPGAPAEFDLDTFLAHSAAHDVRWDAISWHENQTAPLPGDIASSVTNVDRHLALARAVMARHPGTVVGQRIFVNEYGPSNVHTLAGWAVGYFRAFEDGGVTQANRACWSEAECTTQLGGLLTPSGEPTAAWWAHKAYSRLAAGVRMRVASTSSWQVSGLATRDDRTGTVRALLGRHSSCNQPVNPWCTYDAKVKPASLTVSIAWPYGRTPVALSVRRLPAGTGPVHEMPLLQSSVVRPRAGAVSFTLPVVHDGDGISIMAHAG